MAVVTWWLLPASTSTGMFAAQTLSQLHAMGRAHGDLKYANLRVQMGGEPGVFGHLETLDFGSSTRYRGGHLPICKLSCSDCYSAVVQRLSGCGRPMAASTQRRLPQVVVVCVFMCMACPHSASR